MSNPIKETIKAGKVPIGCFIGMYSPALVETTGYAGFDYILIDNEHGAFSWGEVEEMIRACEISGAVPFVRVPSSNRIDILKALDRGAKGIHVPQVNSPEEAERVVMAAKYPPQGNRGTAYSIRAAKYGFAGGEEYLNKANDEIFIAVHVETPTAVEKVEGIMRSGIDVAYIGPTDLAVSAGKADKGYLCKEIQQLMDKVMDAGRHLGVKVGIQVANLKEFEERKRWGASYMGIGIHSIINPAMKSFVHNAHD